jgi:hypothetical protein
MLNLKSMIMKFAIMMVLTAWGLYLSFYAISAALKFLTKKVVDAK